MVSHKNICGGRALRIAVGITALVLLLAGGAGATSDMNISPQSDINNRFIMHRLDAGIPSHLDFSMPFRNQTEELTGRGLNAEYRYGRIPENISLPPVTSIEKAAGMILASAGRFINDNATGGDCTSIGTWNVASKTCTLTTDLTETIEIDSDHITLDGNGHTITGSDTGNGIYLSGRNDVTIKNTNVRNFSEGLYLYSSSNSTLSGNTNSNNVDGIYLGSSSNNTLSGNNASNNYDEGIILFSSNNNMLSGNNASNNGVFGIYLDSSSNNTLSNNNILNNNYGISLGNYGISLGFSSNNTLNNNNILDNNYGISMYSSSNNIASNNIILNNDNGISMYSYSNNNKLSNNNASNNNYGISMYSSSNNTLNNNNALNNSGPGIVLYYSSNNILSNNNASNNYDGIISLGPFGNNNTLSNNNASNNYRYGISLVYSSSNTLSNNNASNNNYGIYLQDSSNNTLSNNTLSNNNYGIYLYVSSSYNTLIDNKAFNNNYGIGFDLSSNNSIYNNFYNNINNLEIIRDSLNKWNTTKTSGTNIIGGPYLGGNFWAYPNGTGFSQTCTDSNSDGICDSPYTLDSNNIDYLPLAYKPGYAGFDTGAGGYPSIMGTHNGTLRLNQSINVSKLYTYPSPGTGGHSEYVKIYNNSWSIEANWGGYTGDWHNITLSQQPFTLEAGVTYNYTIRTGSYPQIIHKQNHTTPDGSIITSTAFIDANGRRYTGWIPAIRLE